MNFRKVSFKSISVYCCNVIATFYTEIFCRIEFLRTKGTVFVRDKNKKIVMGGEVGVQWG